ncbi:SusC/RagA family TonB-linked outer membrane protein [Chryseobacterium sp. SSA4.19]|uniref:SusC/RagA family TonB-linked outer membrane protein n=1 Tax=Chryseobacterium sp. SSA4.19 TaxID=2919915 RepID=UPI001F4DD380|nr:SusC/RagA family TonB-linked outer membrane protein [Chryseobacterium sp. SSA4.19]MCJ8155153.1 SusC/RagA family TonB-linked outer membrane protein [Chryseobacterium sp. SSA4.19]
MKKLTTSVLAVVLTSTFAMVSAQDTLRTQNIREVVVTGALGLKKKNDAFTGNNAVVKTEQLTVAGNPNAVQALTGKVSGLQINIPNSTVNSQATINLRGQRSITGDNSALVVIDGAISTATIFQQLPPEIIESVNVLKGQQGSALYGEKGNNGVLIVTTKKGTNSEKITFTLTSNIDFSTVYKLPIYQKTYGQGWPDDPTYDTTDYNGTNWVPYENSNWGPAYSESIGGQNVIVGLPQADGSFKTGAFSPIDNHLKNFFKTGVLFQNGLSMNVGGRDSYAFLSVNRTQNDFVVDRDRLIRNNILFKGGKKLGDFRVEATFNLIDQNTSETDSNLYSDLLNTPTNVDVRQFANSGIMGGWSPYIENPYWTIANSRYDNKRTNFTGNIKAIYEINKNISVSYLANVITESTLGESHNNGFKYDEFWKAPGTIFDGGNGSVTFAATPVNSNYYKSIGKRLDYYGDLMVNFDYDLTNDINMKLNLGFNNTDLSSSVVTQGGSNLQIPGFYHINNVLTLDATRNLANTQSRRRSVAGFANLDLSYKDYLYFNSTFRYEQSSGTAKRDTGTGEFSISGQPYYSFGLSFIPTKAFEFLKNNSVLNYAKITAGYTKVGNSSAIGTYGIDEVTGLIPVGFPFNVASFAINRNPVDPNITPEFSYSKEASVQLGFFKDRISLGAAFFKTDVDDLITRKTTSSAAGISTLLANVGDMTNKGYELDLELVPFRSKDFEWRVSGSYSTYRSEVTALDDPSGVVNLLAYATPNVGVYAKVGEQFPLIMGSAYERDPEGRIVVGTDGNPLVKSGQQVLGKVTPDYILGFSTSIRYKGFTLSGTADYRTGNSFVALTKRTLAAAGALEETASFDRSQGYVVPNSVQLVGGQYVANTTPVVGDYKGVNNYFANGPYGAVGENFVVDGSALKIREIALSYTLPKSILRDTFVNSVTFGVYARNPFIWYAKSNRNYADPETTSNSGSIDRTPGQALGTGGPNALGIAFTGQYPTTRTFGFSFNATF